MLIELSLFVTSLQIWSKYSDLRFGQIMSNIARYVQMEYRKDMFYMEEDELMEVLREQLR